MNILVTGGAGFIGSHLVESLLESGHRVWTLDDMSTGRQSFLKKAAESGRHTMVRGSVTDKDLLRELIGPCDMVFHLAAVRGVIKTIENPQKVMEGNIEGTRNVLELAYQKQVKVVYASTPEIYGKNDNLPFREDSERILGAPPIRRWSCATAEAIDEHLCFAYAEKGLPITVVRYFNAYGPRQVFSQFGGAVPCFINAALNNKPLHIYGSGMQTRCFTFVRDTVAGTIASIDAEGNGLAFNIGSERPITIIDLALKIRDLTDSASSIVFEPYETAYYPGYEEMPSRIPDLFLAKRILWYEPSVSLDQGLRLTIDWYRQQQAKDENGL